MGWCDFFEWYRSLSRDFHGDEVFDATINHCFTQESNHARCIVFTAITLTENPAPNLPTEKRQPPVY